MSAIQLAASVTSSGTVGTEAFAQPEQGVTLYWFFDAEYGTNYRPYLVKATSLSGNTLQFRGINLDDRTIEIGPTSTTDSYSVNLSDEDHVYTAEPSSLTNIDPNGTKKYAILFLTDRFISENDSTHRLYAAGNVTGPKYPQSAEALIATNAAYRKLQKKYEDAWNEIRELVRQNKANHVPTLQQWIQEFAPDA